MKKIKGKLVKRSSQTQLQVNHHSSADWTKYDERLIECVESEDLEKLRVTLGKKGTSAVKVDPNGTTALHTACLKGSVECLDVLLEEQPDLSSVDKLGCSPLHVAAQSGKTECVNRILQHKVHVGTQDGRKMTALHHAAAKGHKDCVELLVSSNAPLNGKDKDGRTPLLMAIQGAHEDAVKLLLDRGAKVNIADNSKKTALMYASLLGLSKTVDMLLKRGANPQLTDSNDHTAEDYARLCHYKDIINLIHSAPSIANWDAGETSEDTEQEENSSTQNEELISEFNSSLEESEADTSNLVQDKAMSNKSTGESFSSKASTTLSSSRAAQQDLSEDIKELEEENEMLNQELNKLRVQHQKTLERLRDLEAQHETASVEPTANHVNGHVEEEILEAKEKRIEELEKEVKSLTENLAKEKESRNDAEDEIMTLKAQVASYQDDSAADFNSSENDEDVDLPGNIYNKSEQLISLHGQITTLKLENENLREQLKQHPQVNGDLFDVQASIPTIPLTVYQQLKESNEDEIFKLTEELEELKIANESLQRTAAQKEPCPHCRSESNDASTLARKNMDQNLVAELTQLREEFEVAEIKHRSAINMYRLHLLNAYQNQMDPQVQEAIQMIVKLRSSEQFC
ncbi:unnamed protein product [Porites evermanni]|uniref:Ankyrin repeat domain-containing protein 24 n=1 Tax=Porites evermanni TaxID=104178 RepID=A0ABN8MDX3_9CNID|nr:unnamed protein product [Porites evermanni]